MKSAIADLRIAFRVLYGEGMFLRIVLAVLALVTANLAHAQTPAAPRPTIQQLFAAASADPANIASLLIEGGAMMATLPADQARKLGDSLVPFCERAFFSSERFAGMDRLGLVLHKVEKGENPTKICQRYKIGAQMLQYLNEGFDERKMRVGQELKVLDLSKGALEIDVSKSQYRATVWRALPQGGRALVMYPPVGLGAAESPTPIGTTTIAKRVLNPPWTDPATKVTYLPGDPNNVLGGYWMALDSIGIGRSGIGFHGYTGAPAEDWIAKPASHGCVRMLQHDIDRLFYVALEGTTVTIAD